MQEQKGIVVIDFGAQYAHLIARRVREMNVFSEIKEPTVSEKELENCCGIILSGGPNSVYDRNAPPFNRKILGLGKPVLGICYGHQLMAQALGGTVSAGKTKEYGSAFLHVKKSEGLFHLLQGNEKVWMSHGDTVEKLPEGFEVIGSTDDCEAAAVADAGRKFFGLQFHPEVTHTENGMQILKNFVFDVCGCDANWTMENYLSREIIEIVRAVGDRKVFSLVSGGVDSTVALALVSKALPRDRVFALHVDTGFMRRNESKSVKKAFKKLGLCDVTTVDASKRFFAALKGVFDPEEKRKIIGNLFVEIMQAEIEKLGLNHEQWVLCQGTIYPDTIETAGTKFASKIKTHHNRVPVIEEMIAKGIVIEPLKQLYKDEVRALGESIGLPNEMVLRHPFPGPGLAIRALCSNGKSDSSAKEIAAIEKKASGICAESGLRPKVLPLKSVGVQGDSRSYKHVMALFGKSGWKALEFVSTRITNEVPEVNRVVYCVNREKAESINLFAKDLNAKRIELLQEMDEIVMKLVEKQGLMNEIWQFPTVLIPVGTDCRRRESIVLRPVQSREAMTAKFFPLPEKFVKKLLEKVPKTKISGVYVDITHKPPATIEWE
ncbi:MAG: glutamine-hydrolyzing GMP synthase [Candidatus Diapherotrites archaeon]|nr:glutamine-hydrolyzing GMP synthase [Candidatus Diapherotrites archaeon]